MFFFTFESLKYQLVAAINGTNRGRDRGWIFWKNEKIPPPLDFEVVFICILKKISFPLHSRELVSLVAMAKKDEEPDQLMERNNLFIFVYWLICSLF